MYRLELATDALIEEIYESAMKELDDFFCIGWIRNRPNIITVPNRQAFSDIRGRKTGDWEVGYAKRSNVYIIGRENYERESNHKYSKDEYSRLIKHELAHLFYNILSKGEHRPYWLAEGIAVFLSGQNSSKKTPAKFCRFLDFYDVHEKEIYYESGFVVELLAKRFGKEKLLELIRSVSNIHSREEFSKRFQEIYEFALEYDDLNKILEDQ